MRDARAKILGRRGEQLRLHSRTVLHFRYATSLAQSAAACCDVLARSSVSFASLGRSTPALPDLNAGFAPTGCVHLPLFGGSPARRVRRLLWRHTSSAEQWRRRICNSRRYRRLAVHPATPLFGTAAQFGSNSTTGRWTESLFSKSRPIDFGR